MPWHLEKPIAVYAHPLLASAGKWTTFQQVMGDFDSSQAVYCLGVDGWMNTAGGSEDETIGIGTLTCVDSGTSDTEIVSV